MGYLLLLSLSLPFNCAFFLKVRVRMFFLFFSGMLVLELFPRERRYVSEVMVVRVVLALVVRPCICAILS